MESKPAAFRAAIMKNLDPTMPAKLAYGQSVLAKMDHELAVDRVRILMKTLPGIDLSDHPEIASDSDGLYRVIDDSKASVWIAETLSYLAARNHKFDLPFSDVTTWIVFCADKGVHGPGSSDMQAQLLAGIMTPLLDKLLEMPG